MFYTGKGALNWIFSHRERGMDVHKMDISNEIAGSSA